MTDEELCGALTGRLRSLVYQDGLDGYFGHNNDDVIVAYKAGEVDANSYMARFRATDKYCAPFVCIWASDLHLHVFVNGACVFFAMANYAELELMPNARELWNAVRGIQAGGAMPDAARAREQLVAALSGGAA